MSERPPGIPEAAIPPARESAVVIVARKNAQGEWELLMGLRSRRSSFFPGNWAFPGGAVEPEDRPGHPDAHARCGVRELEEETGIRIDASRLVSIGIKVTPPFHPIRYRTEFFVTAAPKGLTLPAATPSCDENDDLRFIVAREAVEEWEAGRALFPPPVLPLLRCFARERSARFDQMPRMLYLVGEYEERVPRLEFVPGVWMYPAHSQTLPPATHTNVWMAGEREIAIVDPGASEAWDIDHLMLVVDRRSRVGGTPRVILLTHHHRDHVAAAAELASRLGIPVRAHAATMEVMRGRGDEPPWGEPIEDGEALDLDGLTLVARHTPGHTAGHLAFQVPERRATLVGDLVSGFSSIFVHPDEGDMGAYIESLRRLAALEPGLLLPAHGPPMIAAALERAIAHREEREARVRAALDGPARPLAEIAAAAYSDTPGVPVVLRELQTRAHLEHMERRGIVSPVGPREEGIWRTVTPPEQIQGCADASP